MAYFDVRTVGELIKEFYEQHKGPDYIDELKVINSWKKVVGPFIASHTINLAVRNHVLHVRVDSDALRSELSYSKSLLLKNLNDLAGKEVIAEMVLS